MIPESLKADALEIIHRLCEQHRISLVELHGHRARHRLHTALRVEILYTLRARGLSGVEIADLLNRDHSSICYLLRTYDDPRGITA